MAARDAEVVLFLDLLGFGRLVGNHLDFPDNEFPAPPYVANPEIARRMNVFIGTIESHLETIADSGVDAYVFSDSAYIRQPVRRPYEWLASSLMRTFILASIPVRMGIGTGTFFESGFATKTTNVSRISISRFYGGAVTDAYKAESSGLKGMRIGVSAASYSAAEYYWEVREYLHPAPHGQHAGVRRELNYLIDYALPLAENTPARIEDTYLRLRDKVLQMQALAPQEPSVQIHYTDTLIALGRLRDGATDHFHAYTPTSPQG